MKTQAGHFCVALKKLRIKNSKWAGSPSWSICYYFLYKQKVFPLTKGFSYQWYSLFSSSSNLFKDGVTPCVRWYIEYRISFLNPTLASVRSLGKVWKSMISSYFLKIFYPQYLLIVYLRVYLYSGFSKNVVFKKMCPCQCSKYFLFGKQDCKCTMFCLLQDGYISITLQHDACTLNVCNVTQCNPI